MEYEHAYYPAVVKKIKKDSAYISVMEKSGDKFWKWPKIEDIIWYETEDVKKKISAPQSANKRGSFKVEMGVYETYCY